MKFHLPKVSMPIIWLSRLFLAGIFVFLLWATAPFWVEAVINTMSVVLGSLIYLLAGLLVLVFWVVVVLAGPILLFVALWRILEAIERWSNRK